MMKKKQLLVKRIRTQRNPPYLQRFFSSWFLEINLSHRFLWPKQLLLLWGSSFKVCAWVRDSSIHDTDGSAHGLMLVTYGVLAGRHGNWGIQKGKMKTLLKVYLGGRPGWLSRLRGRLRLRSWSRSPWGRAPRRALCWQLRAWSLFPILCLPLSLPLPCSCSISLCPKNK